MVSKPTLEHSLLADQSWFVVLSVACSFSSFRVLHIEHI